MKKSNVDMLSGQCDGTEEALHYACPVAVGTTGNSLGCYTAVTGCLLFLEIQLRKIFLPAVYLAVEDKVAVQEEAGLKGKDRLAGNLHMGIVPAAKGIAVIIAVCYIHPSKETGFAVHYKYLPVVAVVEF